MRRQSYMAAEELPDRRRPCGVVGALVWCGVVPWCGALMWYSALVWCFDVV